MMHKNDWAKKISAYINEKEQCMESKFIIQQG